MKKIIAAAAGLMLVGSVVSASAAIEFSGDARARYEFHDNYTGYDNNDDQFNNRIRVKVKGTTAGGSYAKMRLTVGNSPWGSNGIDDTAGFDVTADYAYVGVPMGCVLLNAGRQPLNLTTTYFNDAALDNVRVTYTSTDEKTTLVGLYGVITGDGIDANGSVPTGAELVDPDNYDDVDGDFVNPNAHYTNAQNEIYTAVWMQEWNDSWNTTVALSYINLQYQGAESDDSGFVGVIALNGDMDKWGVNFELGYQEEGLAATDATYAWGDDDAMGAYLSVGYDFSEAFNLTGVAGWAGEGYVYDAPVGFMMIGGDTQLTIGDAPIAAENDDVFLIGLKGAYQANEDLGFAFNLGYVAEDSDDDAFEISAQVGYAINDGTMVYGRTGYVIADAINGGEDDAFGFGVSLELSF